MGDASQLHTDVEEDGGAEALSRKKTMSLRQCKGGDSSALCPGASKSAGV